MSVNSDICSESVTVVLYVLSYVIGPHYNENLTVIIPPAWTKYTGFTSSVRLPICPSVCPSVCGQNRVCSVSSTILVRSIPYLHILSSNFRMCVVCKGYCKIPKYVFWGFFLICKLDFVLLWHGIWYESIVLVIMGQQRGGGGGGVGLGVGGVLFSEHRRSSCSSSKLWEWLDGNIWFFLYQYLCL